MRWITYLVPAIVFSAIASGCAGLRAAHPVAELHVRTAFDYLRTRECELAEERCRLALEYGDDFPEAHNCLGVIALDCRANPAEAAGHFKRALSLYEDFAQAHNNLGTSFMRHVPANLELACEEFNAALEIDPGYLDARENLGTCLHRRGVIAGELGRLDERREFFKGARSQLLRLVEMAPLNSRALALLGVMDLLEDRTDRALALLHRCREVAPADPACEYNLGHVYLRLADCDGAIKSFIRAIGHHGELAVSARKNLTVAYEMCAKRDGAYARYLETIKADPANPHHHFDLGRIYAEKGLFTEAENEWENTLRLEPGYCPAYFELAMRADAALDAARTVELCTEYVRCAHARAPETAGTDPQVEKCRALVQQLSIEPDGFLGSR